MADVSLLVMKKPQLRNLLGAISCWMQICQYGAIHTCSDQSSSLKKYVLHRKSWSLHIGPDNTSAKKLADALSCLLDVYSADLMNCMGHTMICKPQVHRFGIIYCLEKREASKLVLTTPLPRNQSAIDAQEISQNIHTLQSCGFGSF